MEKPDEWKRDRSDPIADCRVFSVREDFSTNIRNGDESSFFVIENPDWANIIPITNDNEVVLIEQFRHGTEEVTLEIPGGMVDPDEDTLNAASRELTEETGFVPKEVIRIGSSRPNPALQENWMHHFLGTGCELIEKTNLDKHESIITRLVPFDSIPDLIRDGKITHSLVIAAFYYLDICDLNAKTT